MTIRPPMISTLLMFHLICSTLIVVTLQDLQAETESGGPTESECRPYIEKVLRELETGDTQAETVQKYNINDSDKQNDDGNNNIEANDANVSEENSKENEDVKIEDEKNDDSTENDSKQVLSDNQISNTDDDKENESTETQEDLEHDKSNENEKKEQDDSNESDDKNDSKESVEAEENVKETDTETEIDNSTEEEEDDDKEQISFEKQDTSDETSTEKETISETVTEQKDDSTEEQNSAENKVSLENDSKENDGSDEKNVSVEHEDSTQQKNSSGEDDDDNKTNVTDEKESTEDDNVKKDDDSKESEEQAKDQSKNINTDKIRKKQQSDDDSKEKDETHSSEEKKDDDSNESDEDTKTAPEDDLVLEFDIPTDLRSHDHINKILDLDSNESDQTYNLATRAADITLRDLKRIYENAIKPLEIVYKYRDLSNRHFGDPEILSKPLILFMGPWSGGKSSIINYLLDNEFKVTSLRTGAEPSPAYFNILLWGNKTEVLDGTQLAADWTFSGLQKFGQGLEERLRGLKLPNKLLEQVNIVEIPGILEVRKQVSRMFPFNDACQWFIDRADIIFLVYDPSKLDVGPETEAILDQLKGREHQTRIILNKADQVKPEELMKVQGSLIWNISPLMSSAQPPVMYTTSLWSRPYETGAPIRLLQAQERAFLQDLKSAIDRRIENKISSARRFAVRVRNHAKMVDCYLTTYYNHKSMFGNKKLVSDQIIEHPQDYHIYEGLSTLTNISRYDLPDPDVYRDFFRLNPLYDFQQLSATCTYFRGCPINRLDVAIAYDLPELVGKYKKLVESALAAASNKTTVNS